MSSSLNILQGKLRRMVWQSDRPAVPFCGLRRLIQSNCRFWALVLPVSFLLILSVGAQAAELKIVSKTILRDFERDTLKDTDADVIPL